MSRDLGLSFLSPAYRGGRIPVMEHPRGLSAAAIEHFTGINPLRDPQRLNEAFRRIAEVFEIDLVWGGGLPVNGETVYDWSAGPRVRTNSHGGEVAQWGIFGAAHQEDGRHYTHIKKPASIDGALDFRPLDHFPQTVEQLTARFTADYARMLESCGDTCLPVPHHYTTAFHWPLAIFGFELLCEAGLEEDRFGALMQRFAEISRRITTAWSRVPGLKAFICHDDLAMTSGPVFPPDWYRRHIFPHYPAIFAPLKEQGVQVIFTSDGDCTFAVEDIFAAGADGLNFEYLVDLRRLVDRHGDKILIGNINSATIAGGPPEKIESETRRCIEIGKSAPRFIVNIGGGLTHDMPPENLERYLRVRKHLARTARR